MHDTEVNKRAREVEMELQKMKEQWINMDKILTKLINETNIDIEYDE